MGGGDAAAIGATKGTPPGGYDLISCHAQPAAMPRDIESSMNILASPPVLFKYGLGAMRLHSKAKGTALATASQVAARRRFAAAYAGRATQHAPTAHASGTPTIS